MAIGVVDSISGEPTPGEDGELVCSKPFPCQPLTFWGPNGESKYRSSYFERFDGVWHHGDFVRIDPKTGGLTMLGRSDGVLKPAGVRFGSAEIYNVLTKFFGSEIEDAVCVGRRRETDRDETVCLFVVMAEGKTFTPVLREEIKDVIRKELSPRHVPGVIEECGSGIPKTGNGKKYVQLLSTNCGVIANSLPGSKSRSSRFSQASTLKLMPAWRTQRRWFGLKNGRQRMTRKTRSVSNQVSTEQMSII